MSTYPIRMIYKEPPQKQTEVDVYEISNIVNGEEILCLATAWMIKEEIWVTTPIYNLQPIKEKSRKQLNG